MAKQVNSMWYELSVTIYKALSTITGEKLGS